MTNEQTQSRGQVAWLIAGLLLMLLSSFDTVRAERIKDLASIQGVRTNQLVGYGLVVGLDGTGDRTTQAPFTVQSLISMLERLGVRIPPNTSLQLKNVAAVAVHADLPPFAKPGQKLDVTVSSSANAESLRGGTLLMAPLKGINGETYAVAQGNLVVVGLGVGGADGSSVSINVPSVGRIPNGATVEREVPTSFAGSGELTLNLHHADFTTATRLATSVNDFLGLDTARPIDAVSVSVNAPQDQAQLTSFVSMIENLEVEPGAAPARVIVNARTGTVIISSEVKVLPAAVSHGTLIVSITEDFDVSQPQPFSETGETVVTPDSGIDVQRDGSEMFLVQGGTNLNEIVQAVNEVGAAPGDLVAILQALKEAGALKAELIVI